MFACCPEWLFYLSLWWLGNRLLGPIIRLISTWKILYHSHLSELPLPRSVWKITSCEAKPFSQIWDVFPGGAASIGSLGDALRFGTIPGIAQTPLVSIPYTVIPNINNGLRLENKLPPTRGAAAFPLFTLFTAKWREKKRKIANKRKNAHGNICANFGPLAKLGKRGKDASIRRLQKLPSGSIRTRIEFLDADVN